MKIIKRELKSHKPIYFTTLEQFVNATYIQNKRGVVWFKVLFENLNKNNNPYYRTYMLFKLDGVPDKPLKPKDVEYNYFKQMVVRGEPRQQIWNVRVLKGEQI